MRRGADAVVDAVTRAEGPGSRRGVAARRGRLRSRMVEQLTMLHRISYIIFILIYRYLCRCCCSLLAPLLALPIHVRPPRRRRHRTPQVAPAQPAHTAPSVHRSPSSGACEGARFCQRLVQQSAAAPDPDSGGGSSHGSSASPAPSGATAAGSAVTLLPAQ